MALGTPVSLGTKNSGAVTSLTSNALLASAAVGDLVVVYIELASSASTVTSVTGTAGNTWTVTAGPTNSGTGGFSLWRAATIVTTPMTTSDTITVNASVSIGISFGIIKVTGALAPLASAFRSSTPTPATALATGVATSVTTPSASVGDACLVFFGVGNTTGTGQTPSAGYTALQLSTNNRGFYTMYRSIGTAGTQTPTDTLAPDPGAINFAGMTDIIQPSLFTALPTEELQHALNRVAGTSNLDAQGAANVWAGTSGRDLLGALNAKNGTTGWDLQRVLNSLAQTSNLDTNGTARFLH